MKKILFLSLILVSSFIFSACIAKDQLKTEILDKVVEVQNKVNEKIDKKVVNKKTELTDEQLLNELNTNDTQVDTELKTLETELQ